MGSRSPANHIAREKLIGKENRVMPALREASHRWNPLESFAGQPPTNDTMQRGVGGVGAACASFE
jgi:hypothetical protein